MKFLPTSKAEQIVDKVFKKKVIKTSEIDEEEVIVTKIVPAKTDKKEVIVTKFKEKVVSDGNKIVKEKVVSDGNKIVKEKVVPDGNKIVKEKVVPDGNKIVKEKVVPDVSKIVEEKATPVKRYSTRSDDQVDQSKVKCYAVNFQFYF